MCGAIPTSNQEENRLCMVALACTGYTYLNIAVSKTHFLSMHPAAALIEPFARALARSMERGDPKVPLGIALPLVICACLKIKCLNTQCVRASVFYSILSDLSFTINFGTYDHGAICV